MPVKIFVGNLQVESNRETETALKQLFEQFGRVVECDILTGKNFGFVHMENDSDANIAIAALHGEEFFGGQINVEKSDNQGKGKKPPRGGGGGMRGGGGGGMRGGGRGGSVFGRGGGAGGGRGRGRGGMERGRGRGGGPGTIGDRRPPPRYDPYARNGAAAARDPYEREAYSLPPSRTRDPYAREVYARDPYARDLYERDPYYGADPYEVDPYARLRAASLYARPPPEYYDRAGLAARDPYYERLLSQSAGASPADRELVSYPLPRTTAGYAKNPV